MRNAAGAVLGTATHKIRKLGGGGFVRGISISDDGLTKVCNMDVFNGYVFKSTDTQWRELFTKASMLDADRTRSSSGKSDGTGCFAAAVAPNNNARIYATYNAYWYVSSDTGASFTSTALGPKRMLANSGAQRLWNNSLVVDDQNANVAMLGTSNDGIYVTTDALATTPTAVTGIGSNTSISFDGGLNFIDTPHLVACDPSSTVTGGIRQVWYISSYGNGIYQSTTGPLGTYTLMSGSPAFPVFMTCDEAGNLWVINTTVAQVQSGLGASQNLHKWNKTTWAQNTTCKTGVQLSAIAIEQGNTNNIAITDLDGYFQRSTDGGTTWIGSDKWSDTYPAPVGREIIADKIPWLGVSPGLGFPSDIMFDPSQTNKLYMSHGLGVCYSTPPATFSRWTWTDMTHGIEELVGNYVLNPPGGLTTSPIFSFWDKRMAVDANLDVFPSVFRGPSGSGLSHSWATDYAIGDPNFLVTITNFQDQRTAYSTDRGLTWTKFASQHPDGNLPGGCVAVGAKGGGGGVNVIWIPGNNGKAVFRKSTDAIGAAWRYMAFPGYATGFGNWVNAKFVRRYIITADKDTPGTFYTIVNSVNQPSGSLDTTMRGVWKSTDEGETWTRVYAGVLDSEGGSSDYWHGILKCVPGKSGELFYTPGRDYINGRLKRSTDGGVTWSAIANVFGCRCFDFGKAAPGSSYPTVFVEATISSVYGIYMSIDNCATWTLLTANPLNRIDSINGLFGDMNIFGRYYIAYQGSGFIYGDITHTGTIS